MKYALIGSLLAVLISSGVILLQCEQKKRIEENLESARAELTAYRENEYLVKEYEKERNKIHEQTRRTIQIIRNISDTPSLVSRLNDIFRMYPDSNQNPKIRPTTPADSVRPSGSVSAGGR